MPVTALDTLLAIKVINLMPDLRQSDRRVGVALVEHFNRRTGRCDPSLERMAGLLGYCVRTVIRSTQKLERVGLFQKIRHGAYSNRNAYKPNWQRFAQLQKDWKEKMTEQSRSRRSEMSPSPGQQSHLDGDIPVTQTCRTNLPKQTCSKRNSNEESVPDIRKRFGVGFSNSSADAARTSAERRWTDALHQSFAPTPLTYGEVVELIDEAMASAATDAEMRSRGSGLLCILRSLNIPGDR